MISSMLRRLPPLNALKAFEAAARHESFTRAAAELSVTQGAVSHQVKALEAELGLKLFNRERQRLVITEAGREYLRVVRDALDRIASAPSGCCSGRARRAHGQHVTRFAAKWLVHRLGLSPRRIARSTCGSAPRCTTSTSRARTWTWRCGMATGIGPGST